ncbi:hypothetical protein DSCO28_55130 [Desulfosarcina ovata subsp. sediminis]|uniref:Uncharacterized protein n=1 Tax=Desulfosarcina ovata subsp. sediminis TaxID=885957 RepID=A0A5K7ZXG4_9BACT|nr:hypothetical protein [Desulfosarcina ovata]BBO84947.1 hypothetical protein DSCO28_55130 [Desulfosarcina ovata subsp. sediminis]
MKTNTSPAQLRPIHFIPDPKQTYIWSCLGLGMILILAGVTYNSTRLITEKTVESHQQRIVAGAAETVDLWLSQHVRIVEKDMFGRIWAENVTGGAQFTIQLPLSDLKGKHHA